MLSFIHESTWHILVSSRDWQREKSKMWVKHSSSYEERSHQIITLTLNKMEEWTNRYIQLLFYYSCKRAIQISNYSVLLSNIRTGERNSQVWNICVTNSKNKEHFVKILLHILDFFVITLFKDFKQFCESVNFNFVWHVAKLGL